MALVALQLAVVATRTAAQALMAPSVSSWAIATTPRSATVGNKCFTETCKYTVSRRRFRTAPACRCGQVGTPRSRAQSDQDRSLSNKFNSNHATVFVLFV